MSHSGARSKRPLDSSSTARRSSPSKKPRFDQRNPSTLAADDSDDAQDAQTATILDLDEIGNTGLRTKRNAVNLDGFESDSSSENFAVRASERAHAGADAANGASKDEEDMDMFADADDADAGNAEASIPDGEGKRRGAKEVRFLDVADIEGQESRSKSGGHVSAQLHMGKGKAAAPDMDGSSSSDSGTDGERDTLPARRRRKDDAADGEAGDDAEDAMELGAGSKKRHAPRLDAFNMRAEDEEGRFDASGNFIRKAADADAVHDNWLDGLSKRDMRRAKEAQEKRDDERRAQNARDDALLTSDLLGTLIGRLNRGETVLEALARLGGKKKRKQTGRWKKKRAGAGEAMDVDGEEEDDSAERERKEAVDAITGAADQLLKRDQPEIYEQEREMLMRWYNRETDEEWTDPPAVESEVRGNGVDSNGDTSGLQWEYRWADARDGGAAHGPYDGATMRSWVEAGYFGEGVEYRQIGSTEWSRSVDF